MSARSSSPRRSAAAVDVVVPGEVGMVVAGAAGERAGVPLGVLLIAGIAGAIAGDQVSFHLGHRYGDTLVDRWDFTRRHVGPKMRDAQRHFDKYGGSTVFVARWVGALRATNTTSATADHLLNRSPRGGSCGSCAGARSARSNPNQPLRRRPTDRQGERDETRTADPELHVA